MRFRFLVAAIIFSVLSFTAQAEKTAPDSTGAIKAFFEKALAEQSEPLIDMGEKFLIYNGEVSITEDGGQYTATLPRLNMMPGGGALIHLPETLVKTGGAQGNIWPMDITLAPNGYFMGTGLRAKTPITLTGQNISGTWNEDLENFETLNAKIAQIKSGREDNPVKLDTFSFTSDLKSQDQKTWSGPLTLTAQKIQSPDMDAQNLKATLSLEGYDPAAKKILQATLKQDSTGKGLATPSSLIFANTIRQSVTADSLYLKNAALPLSAKNVALDITLENLKGELANSSYKLTANDIGADATKQSFTDLLPKSVSINIAQKNAPMIGIADMISKIRSPTFGLTLLTAPQMLAAAQLSAGITDTAFKHDNYEIDINGTIKAEPTALFVIVADLEINILNLDYLYEETRKLAENKNDPHAATYTALANAYKRMKNFGFISETPQGNLHSFKLVITPKGQTTLNGQSLLDLAKPFPNCLPTPNGSCGAEGSEPPEDAEANCGSCSE